MGSCVSKNDSELDNSTDQIDERNLTRRKRSLKQRPRSDYKVKENAQDAQDTPDRTKPKSDDPAESYMAGIQESGVRFVDWSIVDLISEENCVSEWVAENIVKLLENDNTIPFIARYRKDKTRGMEADELRRIKDTYDNGKLIKQRAATIIQEINHQNKLTPEIHAFVNGTKSLNDLEQIHSMFKVDKSNPVEKARGIGLGSAAEAIIRGENLNVSFY